MTTYTGIVRGKWMFDGCKTVDAMIDTLLDEVNSLKRMKEAGVSLREEADDDYAFLSTDDPEVAKQFGFTKEPDPTE